MYQRDLEALRKDVHTSALVLVDEAISIQRRQAAITYRKRLGFRSSYGQVNESKKAQQPYEEHHRDLGGSITRGRPAPFPRRPFGGGRQVFSLFSVVRQGIRIAIKAARLVFLREKGDRAAEKSNRIYVTKG